MITYNMFEEWLDELYPDEETLLNNVFIKFPYEEYEITLTKNELIYTEAAPYYCKTKRFGIDVYCFVRRISAA